MENLVPFERLQNIDDSQRVSAVEVSPKMRMARREEPASGGMFERLKLFLTSRGKSGTKTHADTISALEYRNKALAERLEALEDKSWEIRESEEIYRSLAEAFGDIIIHRDQNGSVVFSNGPYASYFDSTSILPEVEQDEKIETNINSEVTRELNQDVSAPVARDQLIETTVGPRWFSWTDLAIRDPQTGKIGWRSVARDITERKLHENALKQALEKASIASEAKSRFLAMVSHEIRTPLNGVIGMAGLLENSRLTPAQISYVKAINTSGQTLLSLIEDLLDTSRIESGHLTLTNKNTVLERLVEDVAEILAPKAREKGLAFATYIADSVPVEIDIDAGRLRQVLLNIAGNAVKFTSQGGVSIEVDLASESALRRDQCCLTFTVRDSGPGLDKADHEKIFEEFIQTETGATRQFGGAGLGLSISQKIVSQMDGEITVQSEYGKGANFTFSINADVMTPATTELFKNECVEKNVALVLADSPARAALISAMSKNGRSVVVFDTLKQLLERPLEMDVLQAILIDQSEFSTQRNSAMNIKKRFGKTSRIISIGDQINNDENNPACDGWLTWPVRAQSLEKVLLGTINQASQIETNEKSLVPTAKSLNVLLAEDNPINALLAKSLLTNLGHQITHVENGEQALNNVMQNSYDLVFMDLHMPVMDGITAIEQIRSGLAGSAKTSQKIIVLSADGQDEVRQNALDTGADDYLTKPLDLRAVAELLESVSKTAQNKLQ